MNSKVLCLQKIFSWSRKGSYAIYLKREDVIGNMKYVYQYFEGKKFEDSIPSTPI